MKKLDSESVNHLGRFDPLFGPVVLLGALLVWSYWPTFTVMQNRWSTDPARCMDISFPCSHSSSFGFVEDGSRTLLRDRPGGMVLILMRSTLRLGGTYIYVGWVEAISSCRPSRDTVFSHEAGRRCGGQGLPSHF